MKKKRRSKPRFRIKLSNVLVRFQKTKINVSQHPYTLALQAKDENQYAKAVALSEHQKKKKSHDWSSFLKLRKDLKYKGYNPGNEPIVLKWDGFHWYVSHGRHRMCLLWNLYGKSAKLVITLSNKKAEVWKVLPARDSPAGDEP